MTRFVNDSYLADGGGSIRTAWCDLLAGEQAETRCRAARFVASSAVDVEDARLLLEVLGLNAGDGKRRTKGTAA